MKILLWLRIIRPQTLFASIVPVLIGIHIVYSNNLISTQYPVEISVLTTICALSLQILSNLINDFYDFKRGLDTAGRKGFKRALAEGEVSKNEMLGAIIITLCCALSTGIALVYNGGWIILAIGISALLFAWLYTATSHSLSYLGIADIFAFLYYGVIACAGTAYLLSGSFVSDAALAGSVCGLISMCVLMINNLRDIEDDRRAGKRTLPVRFGKKTAEIIMLAEILLMPIFAYLASGILPALIIFPALALYYAVLKAEGATYNKCLLATGMLNLLYLILCLI